MLEELKKSVEELVAKGKTRDYIEGYLLMEGVSKPDILAYLKELGLVGKETFRGWLFRSAALGFVSLEEFDTKIGSASVNVRNHYAPYNNERILANSIHAKYDPVAADLYETELKAKVKVKNGSKAGFKPEKGPFKAPDKPKTASGLYKLLISLVHPDKNTEEWATEMSKRVNNAKGSMNELSLLWVEVIELLSK